MTTIFGLVIPGQLPITHAELVDDGQKMLFKAFINGTDNSNDNNNNNINDLNIKNKKYDNRFTLFMTGQSPFPVGKY